MDPNGVDKGKTPDLVSDGGADDAPVLEILGCDETVLLLIFFDLIARRRLGLAPVGDLHLPDPVNTC